MAAGDPPAAAEIWLNLGANDVQPFELMKLRMAEWFRYDGPGIGQPVIWQASCRSASVVAGTILSTIVDCPDAGAQPAPRDMRESDRKWI